MAIHAFGSLLQRGDGASPEVFTTVAQVSNISGPAIIVEKIDVTHHSSASTHHERIAGLLDMGDVTFDIHYQPDNATHDETATGLIGLAVARTINNWRIRWPTSPVTDWTFPCFVSNFEPDAPIDAQLTASVTLTITGAPTFA